MLLVVCCGLDLIVSFLVLFDFTFLCGFGVFFVGGSSLFVFSPLISLFSSFPLHTLIKRQQSPTKFMKHHATAVFFMF